MSFYAVSYSCGISWGRMSTTKVQYIFKELVLFLCPDFLSFLSGWHWRNSGDISYRTWMSHLPLVIIVCSNTFSLSMSMPVCCYIVYGCRVEFKSVLWASVKLSGFTFISYITHLSMNSFQTVLGGSAEPDFAGWLRIRKCMLEANFPEINPSVWQFWHIQKDRHVWLVLVTTNLSITCTVIILNWCVFWHSLVILALLEQNIWTVNQKMG